MGNIIHWQLKRLDVVLTVLSELAQVFDPLGFLSPILILGKIFVQELWLLKQYWDEGIPRGT